MGCTLQARLYTPVSRPASRPSQVPACPSDPSAVPTAPPGARGAAADAVPCKQRHRAVERRLERRQRRRRAAPVRARRAARASPGGAVASVTAHAATMIQYGRREPGGRPAPAAAGVHLAPRARRPGRASLPCSTVAVACRVTRVSIPTVSAATTFDSYFFSVFGFRRFPA